jgi:hypothetical protein
VHRDIMQAPLVRQSEISVELHSTLFETAKYARDLVSREQFHLDTPYPYRRPERSLSCKESSSITRPLSPKALLQVREIVDATIKEKADSIAAELRDLISPVARVQLISPSGETKDVEGPLHPNFPLLLKMAQARDADGHHVNMFLSGEASSGKTTACKQLAKALERKWYFNGAISMPHEMLGFIDAAGNYHRTPFRDAYEHGGIYTFDEVDRSDPVALLAVNPHLANGLATFPDRQIKRHKDCLIVCTANTWGNGANADYCGATKLDAAFMSRFPARLSWNIDKAFEISIAGNETWAQRVQAAREKAQAAGLKVMIDVRMTLAGAALIASGLSEQEAAETTFLANIPPDQRRMIEA